MADFIAVVANQGSSVQTDDVVTGPSMHGPFRTNQALHYIHYGQGNLVGKLDGALTVGIVDHNLSGNGSTLKLVNFTEALRDSNLTAEEGMLCYTTNNHVLQFYNGTSWLDVATGIPTLQQVYDTGTPTIALDPSGPIVFSDNGTSNAIIFEDGVYVQFGSTDASALYLYQSDPYAVLEGGTRTSGSGLDGLHLSIGGGYGANAAGGTGGGDGGEAGLFGGYGGDAGTGAGNIAGKGGTLLLGGGAGGSGTDINVGGFGNYVWCRGGWGGRSSTTASAGNGGHAHIEGGGAGTNQGGGNGVAGNAYVQGGRGSLNALGTVIVGDAGHLYLAAGNTDTGNKGSVYVGANFSVAESNPLGLSKGSTAAIYIGNTTDNPPTTFLGTGVVTVASGRLVTGTHNNNVGFKAPTLADAPVDVTGSADGDLVVRTDDGQESLYFRADGDWWRFNPNATVSLQQAYVTGNTITTSAGEGVFQVTGTEQIDLASSEAQADAILLNASNAAGGIDINAGTGGVALDTTGAFSIDGVAASNVTVTGANLTLSTITSGTLAVTSAGILDMDGTSVTVDASGAFSIDGAVASNVSTTAANLTLSTITSGTLAVTSAGILDMDGTSITIDATDTTNLTMSATDAADKTLTISATNAGGGAGNIAISASSEIGLFTGLPGARNDVVIGAAADTDLNRLKIYDGGGAGLASEIVLYSQSGQAYTLWVDNNGILRIQDNDGKTGDTNGTVVGMQSA